MDPKIAKAALEALKNDDKDAALALLEQMIASAVSGESAEPPPAAEASATAETAETPPAEPTEEEKALAALSREVVQLSGKASAGEAAAFVRELVALSQKTASDREALEASERRSLVAELVKLGAETPATAWDRDASGEIPEGDARTPKARLRGEPIAELRSRVSVLRAARPAPAGVRAPAAPAAPAAAAADGRSFKTSRGEIKLSAREIKNCESTGADVNAYAENKAIRESARNRK